MDVYLVDGTYELFRHYFGAPKQEHEGQEIAASRGVVASLIGMLEDGVEYLGVATDHVVESFRNDLYPGYKTGEGIEEALRSQFELLEDALRTLGVPVWAMVEYEADDALAAGTAIAATDDRVEQVLICTPDKDLAQCVVGDRIVQFDRRNRRIINAEGVKKKFGVLPESIPDYLALVGDSADGYPGLPGWGAKSTATLLGRYKHLEEIPRLAIDWDVSVRSATQLAATLKDQLELAKLFRRIATLALDAPVSQSVDELEWAGPTPEFGATCVFLDAAELLGRAERLATARAG